MSTQSMTLLHIQEQKVEVLLHTHSMFSAAANQTTGPPAASPCSPVMTFTREVSLWETGSI